MSNTKREKIFLNSLPKAGTNLVAKCLELLGYQQSGNISASLIAGKGVMAILRRAYFKSSTSSQSYLVGIDMPVKISCSAVERMLNRIKEGRFVPGHVGYDPLLLNYVKLKGFSPVLILRDPRAVLNSFVHYVVGNSKHPLHTFFQYKSTEETYRLALFGVKNKKIELVPLLNRCRAVDVWKADPAVLTLRFEDLVGPNGGGSKEKQEDSLNALISFLEIEDIPISAISNNIFGPGRHTFRKGKIYGWKSEMPVSLRNEVDEELGELLKDWGYC